MFPRIWLKWLPWRYALGRIARSYGFIDPAGVLTKLHGFAQPSEVQQPLELIRAGVVFHARGLINTQAIQHNLDWIWPHWVEHQFDPHDEAFLPRAFSITHVNLTHRNWTAVGLPDDVEYPIVDPAGLVTPFYDGWSIDAWLYSEDRSLIPSRAGTVSQRLSFEDGLTVHTGVEHQGFALSSIVRVEMIDGRPTLLLEITASADAEDVWLVVSLRPYNPEGISFIHELAAEEKGQRWRIDQSKELTLSRPPARYYLSDYRRGDVYALLRHHEPSAARNRLACEVGMASGAALFPLEDGSATVTASIVLEPAREVPKKAAAAQWSDALAGAARCEVPDRQFRFLYEAALRTLVLLSPGEVYPGPYTYRRFWFRDAAIIMSAMLGANLHERVGRCLALFPERQTASGYFLSQEGEWDSNGQALWIFEYYLRAVGAAAPESWLAAVRKGAKWIQRKRGRDDGSPHAGLLPPGFSAEHFGPSDYYYWDDFWAVAGLDAAARLLGRCGEQERAAELKAEGESLLHCIERSIAATKAYEERGSIPASPNRRMDAGAIGVLAAGYPLSLWPEGDQRLRASAEFFLERCFVDGAFFQDMIHAGLNAYLTLHVAQVLLRAGDERFIEPIDAVARLASPTGHWPEAIHPRTKGGCMGDGQHAWAAGEWILMLRNMFIREEGNRIVLCSGIPQRWLVHGNTFSFGPTLTRFGEITVWGEVAQRQIHLRWEAIWREQAPELLAKLPGHAAVALDPSTSEVSLEL